MDPFETCCQDSPRERSYRLLASNVDSGMSVGVSVRGTARLLRPYCIDARLSIGSKEDTLRRSICEGACSRSQEKTSPTTLASPAIC